MCCDEEPLPRKTCRRDFIEGAIKCKLNRCKKSVRRVRGVPYGWQRRRILLSYRNAEVAQRRRGLLTELIRALLAAIAVGVLPGWFWARVLLASDDLYERLAYSLALSMALVPAVVLIPTRLLGMGVTLSVTLGSVGVVFFMGLGVLVLYGEAKGAHKKPVGALPGMLGTPALVLITAAFALTLGVVVGALPRVTIIPPVTVGVMPTMGVLRTIAVLVFFAGVAQLIEARVRPAAQQAAPRDGLLESGSPLAVLARRLLLPAVLLLALLRGYLGPVLHDWPFIRGVDLYSHAVMTELMMTKGKIEPYLIYPPGFHTMTAEICRLSGLLPLDVFPVLAPLLFSLTALALYVLARRLWGWEVGVVAALFSVTLGGTYYYFNDAMYPNLVTSQFLLVLTVAALANLYAAPSA